jgi:argininosuccinate synthase
MADQVVLAFSGGLDTSYCLSLLREQGADVVTAIVDTGGMSAGELDAVATRAADLGASEHVVLDARARLYDEFIAYLLKGNYLRNGVYPSCVGVERMVQAEEVVRLALARDAVAVAHGSTGAGNDHVRFDTVITSLAPEMDIITPIRDAEITREVATAWLEARGIHTPVKTSTYSYNEGLMGTSIGGAETYGSWEYLPEDAWPATRSLAGAPDAPVELIISFTHGLPTDYRVAAGSASPITEPGFKLLQALNALGAEHGIGRGIHTGTSIMGTGARLGFEAPGITVLLTAHRELERLVLSTRQQNEKAALATTFGDLLHEGHYYEPLLDDIRAFLDQSQTRVSGEVRVRLQKGNVTALGAASPHSLLASSSRLGSTYGHGSGAWTGADARAFASIYGVAGRVAGGAITGPALDDPTQGDGS